MLKRIAPYGVHILVIFIIESSLLLMRIKSYSFSLSNIIEGLTLETFLFPLLWGYFWGTVSGGIISSKFFRLGDLRKIGSGNIGTTNVMRTGHKKAALLTLLIDAAKGPLAIICFLCFTRTSLPLNQLYLIGLGTVLGHLFPVWLAFRGGKGVATVGGLAIFLAWKVGILLVLLWICVFATTRISSLAAIVVTAAAPFLAIIFNEQMLVLWFTFISPLVIYMHRDNISRLLQGKETSFIASD